MVTSPNASTFRVKFNTVQVEKDKVQYTPDYMDQFGILVRNQNNYCMAVSFCFSYVYKMTNNVIAFSKLKVLHYRNFS